MNLLAFTLSTVWFREWLSRRLCKYILGCSAFQGDSFVLRNVYGNSFSLGWSFWRLRISASSSKTTQLPWTSTWFVKTFVRILFYLFVQPFKNFSYSFPIFTPFFLSCVCSAGLCALGLGASLRRLGGSEAPWMSLECGVWLVLILERQQGAFRPCNRGVQGVFSPGSVISALGFDQHRLPSPLTHCCAIALPWSCPGYLHILGAHPFPNQRGDNQILLFPLTDKSLWHF